MENVEEGGVAGADEAVAVDVGVGRAALAGDGVDALDVLAAEVVEHLADEADALVLAHAGTEERVQLLVGGVHHGTGLGEEGDLVGGLDATGVEEHLLAVDDVETGVGQRPQDGHLDDVDPDRLAGEAVLGQLGGDLSGDLLGDARLGVEGATQGGDARASPVGSVEPRVVQLVVAGGGTEVPDDGLATAGQEGEADQLVHGPGADVRGRHIADIGEVEGEQGAEIGALEGVVETAQALVPEPTEVDPLFPVDGVGTVRADSHCRSPHSARPTKLEHGD